MSKLTTYLVIIVVLLGVNLWLFFTPGVDVAGSSEKYFNANELTLASRLTFIVDTDTTKIELTEKGWVVNEVYPADDGFVNTLISILEKVESRQTIENWDHEIHGTVIVEFDFNSRYHFQFASNLNKTKSYFLSDGIAREVVVPGYRDNITDIFTLHPDQWRNRLILDGSWRTIQKVSVENNYGENFEISFADTFFLFNGQQPADSTAVVEYLNQFQLFQANEMISTKRFPQMDSLSETNPIATVSIDDIKYNQSTVLKIFPNLTGQSYHLLTDQKGQMMVLGSERVASILSSPNNADHFN